MSGRSHWSHPSLVGALAGAAMAVSNAWAQTPELASLEEVVVTAQKRSETLLKVPISITSIGKESLEQRGIKDLADIARATPSLNITSNNGFGYSNVSIRGIDSATGAATTGVYVDDTPIQQRIDSLGPPVTPQVFDLERIEVLRGPQGTLYGAGAEGGAIRYITPAVSLTDSSLVARGEFGQTDGGGPIRELGIAGGAPLVEGTLGFRASAWYRSEDGYIDRVSRYTGEPVAADSNGRSTRAARLALRWSPFEELTITPAVLYQKSRGDDADLYWEGRPRFESEAKVAQPNEDEWTLSSLTVDYDLPGVSLRSISSYLSRDNLQVNDWSYVEPSQLQSILFGVGDVDVPGIPDWTAAMHARIAQRSFSQEIRISSAGEADSRFSWVAGIYYQRTHLHRVRNELEDLDGLMNALLGIPAEAFFGVPPLPGPIGYAEDTTNKEQETSVFGNVTYALSERLKATLGARVARSEFQVRNFQDGPWNAGPGLATGTQRDTTVAPKLNLTFDATPDHMLYASIAKGYRGGGGNPTYANNFVCQLDLQGADAPSVYQPDTVWSYELGTKNRLGEGRFEISGSVFHIDWSDIQSLVFMPTCGNIYTDNLGKAVSQGVDLTVRANPATGLTLSLSAGYTDAHYTETTARSFGATTVILARDGQRLAIPKISGSAEIHFEHALSGGDNTGYATMSYDYAGSFRRNPPSGVFGADAATDPADAVGSLAARFGARLAAFDVALYADNLTNAQPQLLRYHETTGSPVFRGRTLRPRTIGLAVSYGF